MADVLAVASRDPEMAKRFAEALEIPKAYGSYQTLLADPEIDVVYIPLPNHLHLPWTLRAIEVGKHVLCEKPMALTAKACEAMISAANQKAVCLMEGFMYRYHPRLRAALDIVQSGELGDIKMIESTFTINLHQREDFRYRPDMGGGGLMDVGCYCVNFSRLIAGREPVSVQARAVWTDQGVDDQLMGWLDFDEGLMAHFSCALNMKQRASCVVAGTAGYLEMPLAFAPRRTRTKLLLQKESGESRILTFKKIDEYVLMVEDFMRSISGGTPTFSLMDSAATMRVIEALLESAHQKGKRVVIS
jgi:predicted dehydrogenase